ncbi:MAG: exodeoxyribonuclease III [Parvibaculaceae bacterium]
MPVTVATWNINSVRLRADTVHRFLARWRPDILCLQETKCPDGQFPHGRFKRLGYRWLAAKGQPGYHGVAILSRIPMAEIGTRQFCGKNDARHVSALFEAGRPFLVHSLYVPAGGDEPDPEINPKFAHKLAFLDEMESWLPEIASASVHPSIVVGDLNVAPHEHDVWSHKQLLKVVSHTPVETERLLKLQAAGRWIDVMRQHVPLEQKLYTWWSYRARDWEAADRGRRLDHVWLDPRLDGACSRLEVVREARGWPQPSDHVPVIATLDL